MFRASLCPSSGEQYVCYCMCCAALLLLPTTSSRSSAAQHNTCSNIRLVLLKMGIMMPETCWEIVKNKHLTVVSCWFSLSLHNVREFKTVLSVAHASQPVERAENLDTATNCLTCVQAPFTFQLSPSFWNILYVFSSKNSSEALVYTAGRINSG